MTSRRLGHLSVISGFQFLRRYLPPAQQLFGTRPFAPIRRSIVTMNGFMSPGGTFTQTLLCRASTFTSVCRMRRIT